MSVESLFEALPKDMRQTLGTVLAVVRALQERAHHAREHMASLDSALAAAEREPARGDETVREKQGDLTRDIRAARSRAEARFSELVTALETIRLDLLRLRAGVGTLESITVDLAAADAVGRETDRLVAGRREVDDFIRPRRN